MFGSRNTQVYALPPCYKLNRQQLGLTISRQLTQGQKIKYRVSQKIDILATKFNHVRIEKKSFSLALTIGYFVIFVVSF